MRKNSFFIFVCSCIPGAGEMYLNMMKKGITIMCIFWGIIAVGGFLNLPFLMFLLPVIWFYSFFETHNIKRLPEEQRLVMDHRFYQDLFGEGVTGAKARSFLDRRHKYIGIGCIILGVYMILNNFYNAYWRIVAEYIPGLDEFIRFLPTLFVAVLIILVGVHMLRGGKKDGVSKTEQKEDYTEFGSQQ